MAGDYRKCPEYWKPAFGFEDRYEVSTHGHIRNRITGKDMRTHLNHQGAMVVNLTKRLNTQVTKNVRTLVWNTFVGNVPKGYRVVNKSHAQTECYLEGMELASNSDWGRYRGMISAKAVIKISPEGKVMKLYRSITEAAEENGYTVSAMCHRCRRDAVYPAADRCDYAYENDPESIRRALTRLGVDWRTWHEYE